MPSTSEWARKQAERYEASNGAEANLLRGVPIIVLTTVGAKTRRAAQDGAHAGRARRALRVVASKGGAPDEPKWA